METTTAPATTTAAPTTFTAQMRSNDKHWMWKTGLRSLLLVVDIIGIGAVASIVAQIVSPQPEGPDHTDYSSGGFYYDNGLIWFTWGLIPLACSAIWCTIALLIHLIRRRPSAPGVAVGIDLILWLAFIVTTIFIGIGIWTNFSYDTEMFTISDYSSHAGYYGAYQKADNGTWIYTMEPKYTGYSSGPDKFYNVTTGTYEPVGSNALIRDPCTPEYASCAEQDAAFNRMMGRREQQRRVGILGATCEGLALVLHFIVFVWACVDTSRRRKGRVEGRAAIIADKIIQDMINRGQISVNPNTQGMRPLLRPESGQTSGSAGGFGYQQQQQQQQHQQMVMNPAAAPIPHGGYYAPGSGHQSQGPYPQAPSPVAFHSTANQYSRGPSPAPTSPLPQIPVQHQQKGNCAPSPLAPGLNTHTPSAGAHDPPSPISPSGGETARSSQVPHAS